jgi:hypothetical protein
LDHVVPFHSSVRGVPASAPTAWQSTILTQSTAFIVDPLFAAATGTFDQVDPFHSSAKMPPPPKYPLPPTAMQKELLTQDTAVGCPTYWGFWDIGTGKAIGVHVEPSHSPAYVWTPV